MRIYAACLASYNNGILHGAWVDASSDADDMREDINAMLRKSPCPNVTVTCPDCDGDGAAAADRPAGVGPVCETCKGAGEVPSAEEWAIHDMEDLPSSLGEYCGLDAVADAVEFLTETGPNNGMDEDDARALLDDCCGDLDRARELAQEFSGRFDSFRDYAEDYADECILPEAGEDSIVARYFDYDAFARDLAMDRHVVDVPGGVLVFHNC